MNFRSLRLRLLAAAGLTILAALALAGIGLTYMFERHIEHREALSLEAKAHELLAGLTIDAAGRPHVDPYPSDNRFNRPAGGLYWQISTPLGSMHSPSLWDQSLNRAVQVPSEHWAARRSPGPYSHGLLIIERFVRPDTSNRAVLVQLATDDDALVKARAEFGREMLASLAILWVVLMLAAYAQVSLGLRPLARIREELDRLRRNPEARLTSDHPAEIGPLIDAINALAEARASDLARARTRAANLAHSLKTPLAALAAQSRRARDAGATDAADGLDRTIAAASATLESELARARAALARDTRASSRAILAIDNVISVIERTDAGSRIPIEVLVPEDMIVPVAATDLMEMLGALVENAVRHAHGRVRITGEATADHLTLSVGDDGPGLSGDRVELALARGERLDEAGPGHGFGLSIVKDHVEATDGELQLASSDLGGLEARLRWPTAAPGVSD
ncbi:MAG: HAMP domain-containing histidine kinase [Sphingomonadales bacterium]|nr:MAG: HAMP domain-containing histidine kinase [Sphingomonadales bacterium]